MGITRAFLTTSWIRVRNIKIIGRRVVADLLLSENNAILDVQIEVTIALVPAIGYMRGLHDAVPLEGPFFQGLQIIIETARWSAISLS